MIRKPSDWCITERLDELPYTEWGSRFKWPVNNKGGSMIIQGGYEGVLRERLARSFDNMKAAMAKRRKQQQGDKDMSIKDRMEVGQKWDSEYEGEGGKITGLGRDKFFYDGGRGEDWAHYSGAEHNHWTLTQNADGTKADTSGGIKKVDVEFRDGEGYMDEKMDIAMAHEDYICWEDEEGHLHGHFKAKNGLHIGPITFLSRKEWDTGGWVEVKPVKLWFRGGGE